MEDRDLEYLNLSWGARLSLRDCEPPVEDECWEHFDSHGKVLNFGAPEERPDMRACASVQAAPSDLSDGALLDEGPTDVLGSGGTRITSHGTLPWPRAAGPTGLVLEILRDVEFFRDAEDAVYATLPNTGRPVELGSRQLRDWLSSQLWQRPEERPSKTQVRDALADAETWTRLCGEVRPVALRLGQVDDHLYLDLGTADGRVVEITAAGWRIVEAAPLCFVRPAGSGILPDPERGGSIDRLRKYVRATDDNFIITVAWLMTTLCAEGPYPLLYLTGPQGATKSTTARFLKTLVDPHGATLRGLPSSEENLFVAARSGHVLVFDNVSRISDGLSDALCRLATGGSYAGRKRFSDHDEARTTATRPMLLNGIVDATGRPDLADRLFRVELQRVPDDERLPERTLRSAFEADHPQLLGALLDLAVEGLRAGEDPRMASGLRMMDAANWAQACLRNFTDEGRLVELLRSSRDLVATDQITLNPVARAILALAEEEDWSGTASSLLSEVRRLTPSSERRLPNGAAQLTAEVRRVEADLRARGVEIEWRRVGRRGERHILIALREGAYGDECGDGG